MSDAFGNLIDMALAPAEDPLARDLVAGRAGPCFLIGRNTDAMRLCEPLAARGLIDDGAQPGASWNGLPVLNSQSLPEGAVVVNAATSIRPVDVVRRFSMMPGVRLTGLHAVIAAANGALEWPDFVTAQRADWRVFRDEWSALHESLADEASRKTLCDVLRFRLSADPAWMADYEVRIEEQYFEPFLDLHGETFVDAGGFDGDTTEVFCSHDPAYKSVHLFEPSVHNMSRARDKLAGRRDINFHPLGLSDVGGKLGFDAEAGSASAVSTSGAGTIQVVTLDEAVADSVSFIKMDLEGWETRALVGAEAHIARSRPKMALAVYHRASDFRDIARFARGLHPDYRIFLRHYTQGWSETVMFFV